KSPAGVLPLRASIPHVFAPVGAARFAYLMGLAARLEPRGSTAEGARRAAAVRGHRFGPAAVSSFMSSAAKTADCITALLPARGSLRRVLTRSFRCAPG